MYIILSNILFYYYGDQEKEQMCEKVCWVNLYKRVLLENTAAATGYCHNGI
jgi:hypothetical protein